jgi:hypothetical protein
MGHLGRQAEVPMFIPRSSRVYPDAARVIPNLFCSSQRHKTFIPAPLQGTQIWPK